MTQDKRVRWSQSQIEQFSEDVSYYALTEQQISALLTAIGVISWSTRWADTESSFYLEFGTSLADKLMTPIDLCAEIAACIGSSTAVQDALQSNRQDAGYYPSDPSYSNQDYTKVVPTNTTQINDDSACSEDQLFGQATQLTDYMFNLIQDVFDVIDLLGDSSAGVAEMLDRVPVLGKYLNAVPSATAWFLEAANNQWEAGYTVNLRDEIRCGIFCLMKDDCILTVSELVNFFSSNAGVTIEGATLETIMNDMLSIVDGTTTVYAFHALLAGILETGGNWLGVNNVSSLAIQLALGANDPDGDWVLLCTSCAPPVNCELPIGEDFNTGAYIPCVSSFQGSLQDGFGVGGSWCQRQSGGGSNNTIGAGVWIDLATPTANINVQFDAWGTRSSGNVISRITYYYDENDNFVDSNNQVFNSGQYGQWLTTIDTPSVSTPIARVRIFVAGSSGSGGVNRDMRLDNIVITA